MKKIRKKRKKMTSIQYYTLMMLLSFINGSLQDSATMEFVWTIVGTLWLIAGIYLSTKKEKKKDD